MNKFSFLEILSEDIEIKNYLEKTIQALFNKVEIPMIQRDYAQGRDSEKEIRKRFLNTIFEKLEKGEHLELDFVYGDLRVNDGHYDFIPLDGQQRLTTLFLLYWYIGQKELEETELEQLKSYLRKFTYATRISSRRFCENLIDTKIIYQDKPSVEIKDLPWFYSSYTKDSTVKSMLVMLDEIHNRYSKCKNKPVYSNLHNIKFYLLVLCGINSDELYIKMNARGKQLTEYENFKADLIKYMENKSFPKDMEFKQRKMPYHLVFSTKLDVDWARMLWYISSSRINVDEEKQNMETILIGPLMFRFFYRYLTNVYIIKSTNNKLLNKDEVFNYFFTEGKYLTFEYFNKILNKDIIFSIEKVLDKLSVNWKDIEKFLSPSWGDEMNLFGAGITQPRRVIFYAITSYFEIFDYNSETFAKWMRIAWNIVENTGINDITSMAAAVKLIDNLVPHADNIHKYLAGNQIQSTSSKYAFDEEVKKSQFILKTSDWEGKFIEAEKHLFFKGCIDFLITPDMSFDEFEHRKIIAFNVFDAKGINDKFRDNHIFLRGIISRFSSYEDLISHNFTDTDEPEHYLKKMIAQNETVKDMIREWFNIENTEKLIEKLEKETQKSSSMPDWCNQKNWKIKKLHESLYQEAKLQIWMQQKKAYRIKWRNNHIYVSRPSAWYDWIMLDTYRNEIISELLNIGFSTSHQCLIKVDNNQCKTPYYWGNNEILIIKEMEEKVKIECRFKNDSIYIKKADSNEEVNENYDNVDSLEKVKPFVKQIEALIERTASNTQ